jgi:carbamoyl-phosphate synthase large subunit
MSWARLWTAAFAASPGFPVLIDRYLERATEVDVDVLCDGKDVYIGGVMQHVEAAGIHSGDSACATPPHTLPKIVDQIKASCRKMALALDVRGLLNVQMAVKGDEIYVIEINPRASRTVPYVSKATGVPLARMAAKIALGKTLEGAGPGRAGAGRAVVRGQGGGAAVQPLPGRGPHPGPGDEVHRRGHGHRHVNFELAYWKSQIAAGQKLPLKGNVFLSARDSDKAWMTEIGAAAGRAWASRWSPPRARDTARWSRRASRPTIVQKLAEHQRPNGAGPDEAGAASSW